MRGWAWLRSLVWCCTYACIAACGRIAFEPRMNVDAAEPLGPFGVPVRVAELADPAEDDDPTLTEDRLEIFWETTRFGGFKIARATRDAIGAPWSTPAMVPELSSAADEACPELSGDGLTIIFSSTRTGGLGGYDFYISTRATRTSTWEPPQLIPELSSTTNEYCAVLAPSGLEVFFHSERAGGPGLRDLYRAVRPAVGAAWNAPVPIAELNSAGEDESAFPLPGDLELWFASSVSGNRDLYRVTRAAVGEPFAAPMPIAELATPADESDAWLSRDGRTLFFSSNRDGNPEIYEASR